MDQDDSLYSILPEGYIPVGFVASIKALDTDGDVCLVNAKSPEVSRWEAVGMLTSLMDDMRDELRANQDEPD